jgi:hypothetical protein
MNPFEDNLWTLADRMREGDATARHRLREQLEASLVPMIRCALRTGRGVPAVVQWVRRNLSRLAAAHEPGQQSPDPERTAPALARLLCATLLEKHRPRPAFDTVVGR